MCCGHGPSGRNGGFCNSLWFSLPTLASRFGDEAAPRGRPPADESVHYIGEWCEANGVDARYRQGGYLQVSTCEAQDGTWEPVMAEMQRLGVPASRPRAEPRRGPAALRLAPLPRGGLLPDRRHRRPGSARARACARS